MMNHYLKNNCYHRRLADLMKISPCSSRVSHRRAIEEHIFTTQAGVLLNDSRRVAAPGRRHPMGDATIVSPSIKPTHETNDCDPYLLVLPVASNGTSERSAYLDR